MSGYNQVDDEFWADTIDWPDDHRDLAIYLLTCEYRNQEGLFRIRTPQIVLDRAWDTPRVEAALEGLTARGWCIHEDGWMLLTKSLRWAPPAGPKQIPGAARKVRNVPRDTRVWAEFYAAATRFAPAFAAVLDAPTGTPSKSPDTVSGASETVPFSTQLNSTPPQAPRVPREPAAAPDLTVVPPPPRMDDHPDQAAALLDKAGVIILDASQIQRLHDDYPDVDLIACARKVIARHRDGGIRGPAFAYFRGIVTSQDAPPLTPAVAQQLPQFDQAAEAVRRAVERHHHQDRFALRDLLASGQPAAAALLDATDTEPWWKHDPQSFEHRQFLAAARATYDQLTVDPAAIEARIDELNGYAHTKAELNGQEYVAA